MESKFNQNPTPDLPLVELFNEEEKGRRREPGALKSVLWVDGAQSNKTKGNKQSRRNLLKSQRSQREENLSFINNYII
jgi:hypothetical protein